ncbi:MAG: polysaccharide biosynthesis protein [Anaerolineae bacterium]
MLALRNRHFFIIDLILLPVTAVLAFALRLDARGMERYVLAIALFVVLAVPIKLLIFYWLGLYRRFWRYASVDELLLIAMAVGVSLVITSGLIFGLVLPLRWIKGFPRSIPFIDGLLTLGVVGGPRFAVRLSENRRKHERRRRGKDSEKRVVVVGAGSAGTTIVKELQANPHLGLVPLGFVDDDRQKHGVQILGVPVLGGRERIPELAHRYHVDEVIIAMPAAPGKVVREIVEVCRQAGLQVRTVPGLSEILSGRVSISQVRKVDVEDLLRRKPVHTDTLAAEQILRDCRVLVTGAGGSIGSELCRQIARQAPSLLILMGHGENSIFAISNELQRLRPGLPIRRAIADVRDLDRLRQVFETYRPQTVFHAAAHKHVPLMEENMAEAITNNVQGTANLLQLSELYGVGRFVLISTDKAVNPSSVMGATKWLAERLVQRSAQRTGSPYVSVRFGNVLESRGSVVLLFREQIARGGPVTVTHPDVCRYFMTIPEAVQLVLQASALGQGGEVFVLDMGEPVRIADLARDMIHLSGLEVGRDIEIVYTGLRPGEKLMEELIGPDEGVIPTCHEKIFSLNGTGGWNCVDLETAVQELIALARQGDERQIRAKLQELVPHYLPCELGPGDQI